MSNVRHRSELVSSELTSYENGRRLENWESTSTVDNPLSHEFEVTTTAATYDLGNYDETLTTTGIAKILIRNQDTTNGLWVTYYSYRGTAGVDTYDVSEIAYLEVGVLGDTITLDRSGAGVDFTDAAMDFVAGGYVRAAGTTNNNGTFLIASVTATVLTLGADDLTNETPTTQTLQSLDRNRTFIPASQWGILHNPRPELDLSLIAVATTRNVDIVILGT